MAQFFTDRLWLWGAWGKNQIDLEKLGQLDTEGHQVNENSTLENFDARLDAQLAASNSLELFYHHGNRIQDGRGVDINTAPESRLRPDPTGPHLQDRRHPGLFLEPDGDGLLLLHGLHADGDASRGCRHAGLRRF